MPEQKNKYDLIRERVTAKNEAKRKARQKAEVPLNQLFGNSGSQQKASKAFNRIFGRSDKQEK